MRNVYVGHHDGIHIFGPRNLFWLHAFVWRRGHRRWPLYVRFEWRPYRGDR